MKRFKLTFVFLAFGMALTIPFTQVFGQTAKTGDPWEDWQFLLGEWVGSGSGKPGEAVESVSSFRFELEKNILVRRNRVIFAPKPGEKKGYIHEDFLFVYPSPGEPKFRAIYFDNEGHVIRYKAVVPEQQNLIRLESEDPPTAMRFRLDYAPNPDHTVTGVFSMAAPGDTFKVYTQGVVRRKP